MIDEDRLKKNQNKTDEDANVTKDNSTSMIVSPGPPKKVVSAREEYAALVFSGRLEYNPGEPTDAEVDDEIMSASSWEE